MKKMLLVSAALAASLAIAGCNRAATTNNTAAPANKAAPAAPPAGGNTAGGNAAGGGGGGAAAQQNFTFVNQSGQVITTLQVSATGESSWGEDILGRDVLANGESAQIEFERGDDRCLWDIRATAEGGGELDMRNVDLCTTTTVTATPAG
jgi:hypothetical protein